MNKKILIVGLVAAPVIAAAGIFLYGIYYCKKTDRMMYEKDCVIERSFEEIDNLEGRLAKIKEKHERMTKDAK